MGSSFTDSRPSVKSTCTLWAPASRHRRMSASASPTRSSRKASRGYPGSPSAGYSRLRAEAEITACFTGTVAYRLARSR